MLAALYSVLSGLCWLAPAQAPECSGSFLYQPAFCIDEVLRCPAEAYVPQPGDIMLRLDHSKFWRTTHWIAFAFDPNGSAIVFARPDGSLGHHGYVTALLEKHGPPQHLVGCGPEPMLRALARLAERWGVPCHVSLETPMACGVGICFSCVTRVRTGDGWDYRRVCVDGPVFDAACLHWGP